MKEPHSQHSSPASNPKSGVLPHRRAVLLALLCFVIGFGTVFVGLNLAHGYYPLAAMESAMVVLSTFMLAIVPGTQRLQTWIFVFLMLFFSMLVFALTRPGAHWTVFVWVLLIPMLSYYLLGRWLGMAVAMLFMMLAGGVFFVRFGRLPELNNVISVANVVLCAISIFGFAHVYESNREHTDRTLRHLASTDPLTGLANRLQFRSVLESECRRASADDTPLSILLIDLDHFKRVNDKHGHDAGDAALCAAAGIFAESLRSSDLAGRLGGEEFGVILADTNALNAHLVAERVRAALAEHRCDYKGHQIALTLSVGVAELGPDGGDLNQLYMIADRRLYHAKKSGRNRVIGRGEDLHAVG